MSVYIKCESLNNVDSLDNIDNLDSQKRNEETKKSFTPKLIVDNTKRSSIDASKLSSTKSFTKKWNIFATLALWNSRLKQRKALSELDDRLLDDIGYSLEEAREEYTKPFWK